MFATEPNSTQFPSSIILYNCFTFFFFFFGDWFSLDLQLSKCFKSLNYKTFFDIISNKVDTLHNSSVPFSVFPEDFALGGQRLLNWSFYRFAGTDAMLRLLLLLGIHFGSFLFWISCLLEEFHVFPFLGSLPYLIEHIFQSFQENGVMEFIGNINSFW